ncbi:hypothetical protein JCM10207_001685 [Rhodosporidiobolus poonsookiae]
MADYWVSRDKYWCKYCKTYIADDKPSRTHHETGLRHKGNYERYIRDIYKKGITEKKEAREEAKEMERIEAAAAAAMGLAPPVPSTSASASAFSSSSKPAPAPPKPSDPYANYTTAASLGLVDEHAEKLKAEREARAKEGTIGGWERVVRPPKPKAEVPTGGLLPVGAGVGVKKEVKDEGDDVKPDVGAVGAGDAAAAAAEEDDGPVYQRAKKRGFLSEKAAAPSFPSDDDDDDPLAGLGEIKLKKRRLTVREQQAEAEAAEAKRAEEKQRKREARERGAGGGWSAGRADEDEGFDPLAGLGVPVAAEGEGEGAAGGEEGGEGAEAKPVAEEEEKKPAAGGGFKKRKMLGASKTKGRK